MSDLASRFDEQTYLAANPDLRAAIERGKVRSAFEHWIASGRHEPRPGMPQNAEQAAVNYLNHPAPPAHLRLRVHGDESSLNFIKNGQVIALDLLKAMDVDLREDSRILDFGCGCGRVISFLKRSMRGRLFGIDIDGETIDWCKTNIGDLGTFSKNAEMPPLAFPASSFDLIYSVSVFTHLPEDMQDAWLEELGRVMKPGATALLTVQGELPSKHLPQTEIDKFNEIGLYYHLGEMTDGLPEFYRSTWHTAKYIREHWSKFFDIERIIARGVNNHQDIVVCRKR